MQITCSTDKILPFISSCFIKVVQPLLPVWDATRPISVYFQMMTVIQKGSRKDILSLLWKATIVLKIVTELMQAYKCSFNIMLDKS